MPSNLHGHLGRHQSHDRKRGCSAFLNINAAFNEMEFLCLLRRIFLQVALRLFDSAAVMLSGTSHLLVNVVLHDILAPSQRRIPIF